MRNIILAEGEYYHIYNRGVEKRIIFEDKIDYARFLESMVEFNTIDPIGSLYELSFSHLATRSPSTEPLVEIVAYCLNPNHFHMILKQVAEHGISKFMKRLGGGYSWYFNNRYKRSGSLFQGPYRAKHVSRDEYLLRLSAYVNLNDRVHLLGDQVAKYGSGITSWADYVGETESLSSDKQESSSFVKKAACANDVILGQFASKHAYKKFAEQTLVLIHENKEEEKMISRLSFD